MVVIGDPEASMMDLMDDSISSISSVITSIKWMVCFNSIDFAGITEPMEPLAESSLMMIAISRP